MSACKHAKPLGYTGWNNKRTGDPVPEAEIKALKVECNCGWRGDIGEILNCDGEVDCTETMWCPQCKTSGWIYS